jgi:hypothetical protein
MLFGSRKRSHFGPRRIRHHDRLDIPGGCVAPEADVAKSFELDLGGAGLRQDIARGNRRASSRQDDRRADQGKTQCRTQQTQSRRGPLVQPATPQPFRMSKGSVQSSDRSSISRISRYSPPGTIPRPGARTSVMEQRRMNVRFRALSRRPSQPRNIRKQPTASADPDSILELKAEGYVTGAALVARLPRAFWSARNVAMLSNCRSAQDHSYRSASIGSRLAAFRAG